MLKTAKIRRIVFLINIFIGFSRAQQTQDCSAKEADIVFLLDSSSSEGVTNFDKQIDFVKNFTQQFDIGPNKVQIGVVTFSSAPHNEFWLNDFSNKADVLYGLSSIKYQSGNTQTDTALTFVKDQAFSQNHGARGAGVEKLLIVLTDGQSQNSAATVTAAQAVHSQGIHTISIGIGSGVNQQELQSIASDPNEVFTVQNFNVLSSIQKDLEQVTCNTTKKCQAKADIAFVLDSSGSVGSTDFQKQLDFVKQFVKSFPVGPNQTQFSVLTFSDSVYNQFYFNDIKDLNALVSTISNIPYNSGSTYTDQALNFVVNNTFQPQHGARVDAKHIVIVMTDGGSTNPQQTIQAAKNLHNTGVEVMSIGIGSASLTELQTIASDNQHVFQVISFDALTTIQSELEKTACKVATPVCSTKQADIVFLLDSSSSEGDVNFQKQVDFVKNFVKQFDIGPNKVQVGVVTFESLPHNQFWLNDFQTKTDVLYGLSSIKYSTGNTYTDKALAFVGNNSFNATHGARPGVEKILIVMTDGQSANTAATAAAAQAVHKQGIHTISIGIGTGVNQNELQNIATDPNEVFTVQNFNVLSSIQKDLQQVTCNTTTTPAPVKVCGDELADIVFVLDSSGSEGQTNFQKQLDFVRDFMKQFQIGPNAIQVGMVTFSGSANNEFFFNTYNNQQSISNKLQNIAYMGSTTNTAAGLQNALRDHFQSSTSGARPNVKKIAIVMTDGGSDSRSSTLTAATNLKSAGVTVISIGIGSSITFSELQGIASDKQHVFNVSTFDALNSISQELKDKACGDTTTTTTTVATTTTTIATTTKLVCSSKQADIVFLLDASTSEGQTDFQQQVDFVKNFVKQFNIGPTGVQIGVATFATVPHNEFWLNDFTNKADVLYGLSSIKYSGGDTYTGKALTFAKDQAFSSAHGARGNGVEQLLIVLTDGKSLDSSGTTSAAHLLHNAGIHTISIGIGSGVNQQELQTIATDPSEVFTVQNFNVLSSIQKDLQQLTCNTTTTKVPDKVCGDELADIVFVLDSSGSEGQTNFQKQLDFVRDFMKQFQIGPNAIQVGMVTFSGYANNEFFFNTYNNQQSISNKLQNIAYMGSTTNTAAGLRNALSDHFQSSTSGARPNVKKIAIVMTDGGSDSRSSTLTAATNLKNAGVTAISIGIGSSITFSELQGIASDKQHVFNVSSFDALTSISQELKDKACATTIPTTKKCSYSERADIIFALDASGSEGTTNFQKQLDFVSSFVQDFTVGPNNVQFSIVTFSDTYNNEFYLNQFSDKASVLNAIQQVSYSGGNTQTDRALSFIRTTSLLPSHGARPSTRHFVIVMTDGQATDRSLALSEAAKLKKANATVVAIGIGSSVDRTELNSIASDSRYVYTSPTFDALTTIKSEVKQATCDNFRRR